MLRSPLGAALFSPLYVPLAQRRGGILTYNVDENVAFSATLPYEGTIAGGEDGGQFTFVGFELAMSVRDFEEPIDGLDPPNDSDNIYEVITERTSDGTLQTHRITVNNVIEIVTPTDWTATVLGPDSIQLEGTADPEADFMQYRLNAGTATNLPPLGIIPDLVADTAYTPEVRSASFTDGFGTWRVTTPPTVTTDELPVLLLSETSFNENKPQGSGIGEWSASNAGVVSNVVLTDHAGNKVQTTDFGLEAGATLTDFEVTTTFDIEVECDIDGDPYGPFPFTLTVLNVIAPVITVAPTLTWTSQPDPPQVGDAITVVAGTSTGTGPIEAFRILDDSDDSELFDGPSTTIPLAWDGLSLKGEWAVSNSEGSDVETSAATDPVETPVDVTAPVLSNFLVTPVTATTAAISVDTNEGNGTFWAVVIPAAAAAPNAAQIKAGTNGSDGAATWLGSVAVGTIGSQALGPTGLTEGTAYVGYAVHTDAAGNNSAVASDAFTLDVTGPTSSTLSPADNATNAAIAENLVITFNESVQFGTGTIRLYKFDDTLVESFDVVTEVGAGAGQVSISGAALTINPTASLLNNQAYYVQIDATAIEDLEGNAYAGIADETTWSFTSVIAFETETDTLIAAFSSNPGTTRNTHINTLIAALKTAGVWTKLDLLYLTAAHDSQAAGLNWKNPATFALTPVNSPTFTTDRGYAGNGTTSYLNTGFTPTSGTPQWVLNSAHIGLWSRTAAVEAKVPIGARTTSTTRVSYLVPRFTGDVLIGALNQGSAGFLSGANADGIGHFVVRRSASTASAVFKNGSSVATSSTVSTVVTSQPIFIGADNTAGSASLFSATETAAAHVGANLTDQNIIDTHAALAAYMTAVGV